jgi:hypothetical protein
MPPIIPGQNGSQPNQPDFLRWLQQVFPQLAPQQPRSLLSPGAGQGSSPPPWVQPFAQQAVNTVGRPNLQTSTSVPGGRDPQDPNLAKIDAFLTELETPLDFNNPMVAAILRQSQSVTAQEAQNRGIQGGLALSQQQQAYINAAAQLDAQRQALRARVLADRTGYAQRREETDYNRWMQQQQQNVDPWRTAGGVIGGAAGAGLGIGASLLSGGAALPLVPGLISGGSQIGAGLGGQAYEAFNPSQYQPQRSYSDNTPRLF